MTGRPFSWIWTVMAAAGLGGCVWLASDVRPSQGQEPPRYAGPKERGFLLPNGWTITPAGRQVELNDLPLNILPSRDGKRALVANNGFNAHYVSLVDLESGKVIARQTEPQSWFGLAWDQDAGKIYWSGGGLNNVNAFTLNGDALHKDKTLEPGSTTQTPEERKKSTHFRSGVALSPDGKTLYTLDIDHGDLTALDLTKPGQERTVTLGGRPYDVVVSRDGKKLYVSDWAQAAVRVVEAESLRALARIRVGEHPNQIALHPQDDRIFVACASTNSVVAIDALRGIVTETIFTSLFPRSPEGSTPDAVAVSPDGQTLYVANADNNCIAVIDIAKPNESQIKGFIPTGWYPTAVAVAPDGKTLLVGVGKGNQTKANPVSKEALAKKDANPGKPLPFPYIGTTLSGALSIVPVPDEKQLQLYTETVYKNCPYSNDLLTNAPAKRKTAIPAKVGDPSPIRHVIYIIKENRTYDQVFGDMERGNGDPSLTLFGREVTPNHHKLAEEFVLLDNLYCNGQVSRDGHPWSTMAYNTDYIARDWMLTYSKRSGIDDDDDENLRSAPSGYIWDLAARKGLSYRSYGEYGRRVSQPDGSFKIEGSVPGLVGHISPDFGAPATKNQVVRDTDRVETFLKEYREFERTGTLPHLMIMSLGEDHTHGTSPGKHTPQACVASNDLALGRLVEAVSQSPSWGKIAIFVIEDDAQNGPDHVDAHRTVGLVISPYVRRKHLDSTQYTTCGMLRTIELILGLPPLSQYDASANPMFESFTDQPDLTPYAHEKARINLDAVNQATAYGAARSSKMDFSEFDRINDFELNEILWRAIKGADAPLPPAVRRAIAFRPNTAADIEKPRK